MNDPDPFTIVDYCEIQQALNWRDRLLGLERSTLSIRIAYRIETLLEKELT